MKTFRMIVMVMVMTMTTSVASAANKPNWKKQTPMPEPPKLEVCHECGCKIESAHRHEMACPRKKQPKQNVQFKSKSQPLPKDTHKSDKRSANTQNYGKYHVKKQNFGNVCF